MFDLWCCQKLIGILRSGSNNMPKHFCCNEVVMISINYMRFAAK